MISDELVQRVAEGELQALCELDAKGIFCADDENAETLAERVRTLKENQRKLDLTLQEQGHAEIEDISMRKEDRIPTQLFEKPTAITELLFRFKIDWVSGFFIDPAYGLFFGGCAYCMIPDFFALFIIRRSFKEKDRWLFYQRDELLAHELCHVSRVALASEIYEEIMAYKTATTAFRRFFGGIFRSPRDSAIFLILVLLLFISQLCQTFFWPGLPVWPAWLLLVLFCARLLHRHCGDMRRLARAAKHLTAGFPPDNINAVLFRCNDQEIRQLAELNERQNLLTWLQNRQSSSLRWQVIMARFSH
ncbi:MAG: hypothetical protein GX946_05425 [Oligosphaeraceae bacterium]|nr:hypothetical protein [Oligosphaeraceae bacterium]